MSDFPLLHNGRGQRQSLQLRTIGNPNTNSNIAELSQIDWLDDVLVYFIGLSLQNSVVQCLYYATNNLATCFDSTAPSSGL